MLVDLFIHKLAAACSRKYSDSYFSVWIDYINKIQNVSGIKCRVRTLWNAVPENLSVNDASIPSLLTGLMELNRDFNDVLHERGRI